MTATIDAELSSDAFSTTNLRVHTVKGHEEVGRLYELDIGFVSEKTDVDNPALDVGSLVGADVSLSFLHEGRVVRTFDGFVVTAEETTDRERDHLGYRIRLAPQAFRLTLTRTHQIFMEMSVPDIIRAKFEQHGLGNAIDFRLLDGYAAQEFVVQYDETDLDFVSRIAEHAGISFFFDTDDDGESIVFSDHADGFTEAANALPWSRTDRERGVYGLMASATVVPRLHVIRDYNYRTPALDVTGVKELDDGAGGGQVEYGSHVKTPEDAEALARVRTEEALSRKLTLAGESSILSLAAGTRVRIDGHPTHSDGALIVVRVTHDLATPRFLATEDASQGRYTNRFSAVPAETRYRPPRRTKRPRIFGVVTGIIQPGPGGSVGGSAQIDAHGRYIVQFHFDPSPGGSGSASKPVRMAQPFAGYDEGLHFPLKPGTEVLLAFIDGDPDRPIIVGALPNPETPSQVTSNNVHANRIKTATGVLIEFGKGRGVS